MIKTIAFDLGGVITNEVSKEILDFASAKLGIKNTELQNLMDRYEPDLQMGKIGDVEFWRKILSDKNMTLPDSELSDIWLKPYVEYSKTNERVLKLVDSLRDHYVVGLISNTQEPHITVNKQRGLYDHFDPLILSSEVGVIKPDFKIFELYLEKVKCKSEEMVFIDDRENNLINAKQMGIHTILFQNYEQLLPELAKLGINF